MDSVGDSINAENANWNFEGEVSKTFDEHVSKSVPLYYEGHDLCAKISDFFLANDSVCYELGCSTGSLTKKLAERNIDKRVRFIAVDSVDNMIEQANKKLSQYSSVETKVEDINLAEMEKSDFIVSYYTIQFVRPQLRQELINKIYNSLNWGGGFLLFEKVRAPDARFQDMMTGLYTDFKLDNGYTSEQIVAKTRSLKGVLEPFSTQGNMDLMKRAGFEDITSVMKYVCFEGTLAIK